MSSKIDRDVAARAIEAQARLMRSSDDMRSRIASAQLEAAIRGGHILAFMAGAFGALVGFVFGRRRST